MQDGKLMGDMKLIGFHERANIINNGAIRKTSFTIKRDKEQGGGKKNKEGWGVREKRGSEE